MSELELTIDHELYSLGALVDRLSDFIRTSEGQRMLRENSDKLVRAYARLGGIILSSGARDAA